MALPKMALDKLERVVQQYDLLKESLSHESVFSDPRKLEEVGREIKRLESVAQTFRQYRRVLEQIRETEEIVETDDELAEVARQELQTLAVSRDGLESRLMTFLVPEDPMDSRNVFLEIRAGTGGEEAALFAADLLRAYTRFAEGMRWETEVVEASPTELGGMREVIVQMRGRRVYSMLKYEAGVHRVQRVPVTEAQGRIHTSAVTVAVLPEADDVDVDIREEDLKIDVFRAHGAGGQHVNKTDSAVRITHLPTNIVVTCQDERSQHRNKAKALRVLRARLYEMKRIELERRQTATRRAMVGSGDRSQRIRTYNFPQNRVTDHRIGLTLYSLDRVMEGEFLPILEALQAHYAMQALMNEVRDQGPRTRASDI